jgi:hypothetical protein
MKQVAVFLTFFLIIFANYFSTGCKVNNNKYYESDSITLASIGKFKTDVIKKYNNFNLIYSQSKSMSKAIKWIKKESIVKDAGMSKDKNAIWIVFNNNMEIDIIVKNKK